MKLLLDTHIWIWGIRNDARLSVETRQSILDPNNERWLSPISIWEALRLEAKGRILPIGTGADWLQVATAGLHEAPVTHEIAARAARLDWDHRDPADRFLAATAAVYDLTLVTADRELLALKSISTLSSR